jgi:hypothetical protein
VKARHARQIRQGILHARRKYPYSGALSDLAYKAFRRESDKRIGSLLRRLSVLQVESETAIIMHEAAETILNERRE